MTTKKILTVISLLLIGFMIGWCVCSAIQFNFKDNSKELVEKDDSINRKIDSVKIEVIKWRDSINCNDSIKNTKIKEIKELPLDSAILYLKNRLKEYE